MSVQVHIIDGPLGAAVPWDAPPGHGALVCFEGVARPMENGEPIAALDYEAYEPMATESMRKIAESIVAEHGVLGACVEHSTGRVAAGACSFRLRIAGYHRAESLAAVEDFIVRMKRDVPIWKMPIT